MIDDFIVPLITLDIVFLVDTSASMAGRKIDELNNFMAEAVKIVEKTAAEMEIRILIRVIEFNSEAKWLFGDANNGVEHIEWHPLRAGACGDTNTSAAINLARDIMHRRILGERSLPPVVVLVSDGLGTDAQKTMEAIERLKCSLGRPVALEEDAVRRIAICVGGANEDELIEFSSVEIKPASTKGGNVEADDLLYYNPLILRADEFELFGGLLKSYSAYPKVVPVWQEENGEPVMTVIGVYDDEDWEE